MDSLEKLSDQLWTGKHATSEKEHHPFVFLNQIEDVSANMAFYKGFSNISALKTDDGLVLIDTGSFHPTAHGRSFKAVRSWSEGALNTAIYTHGHVDHAYGLPPFLAEAESKGWKRPDIVGHGLVNDRMDRYIETAGYNEVINERQFGHAIEWPTDPIRPTQVYDDTLELEVGGTRLQLTHARGETDDHTWVFVPDERVLCTGDLFIWAAPNAGNPQKVQRYIKDWAEALRQMATLSPEVLLPGHGVPVYGEDRVQSALLDSAEYLESIYGQTVALMNEGASVDELIHTVKVPDHLAEKPFLQPVYDEPDFIVRNIHRCLGGWYSGTPCDLKPAPRSELAKEVAEMSGGVGALIKRAEKLQKEGNVRLACHFADWAIEAEPESVEAHAYRAELYDARAAMEPSTMSKGVFNAAARDSRKISEGAS